MVLPPRCPWCGRGVSYVRRNGSNVCQRTVVYQCGTQVSDYPVMVQVSTPCYKGLKHYRQWVKPKRWSKILAKSKRRRNA